MLFEGTCVLRLMLEQALRWWQKFWARVSAYQISTVDTAALQSQYMLKMPRKETLNILLRAEPWDSGCLYKAASAMSHLLPWSCRHGSFSPLKLTASNRKPAIAIVKARATRFTSLAATMAANPFSCQYLNGEPNVKPGRNVRWMIQKQNIACTRSCWAPKQDICDAAG